MFGYKKRFKKSNLQELRGLNSIPNLGNLSENERKILERDSCPNLLSKRCRKM